MFNDLCIFTLFVISTINPLISDDGDFVCYHVISEMQHALETRLLFYKWRYKYLLNSCNRMAMMKAMPLKVECSNKISPLLHLYFYNINFFNASFKSQFYFTHNLDELYVIVLDVQQYTLSMSTLVGNLFPRILNFFHHSVNKKMPWVHYCLGEANVCLRSRRKINSHKMFPLQVTLQRQYSSLHLQNCYFFLKLP